MDFDGVFTDNKVFIHQDGHEMMQFSKYDSYSMRMLESSKNLGFHNLNYFVLSTETNQIVVNRCSKMKVECYTGVDNKLEFIENYFVERGFNRDGVSGLIYLGNDLNDYEAVKSAGFSFVPKDAHKKLKQICSRVSKRVGGDGFVRDSIEYILDLENWESNEISKLVSNS
jgi:YrbI family 3-deoxy-D-manno-octulosonate 8-phosphate phosphatase